MVLYPEVQQKARQELDAVIGDTRLPEFEDYDALPYIQAIVLESLRWLPVLPLSIPHKVMVEDEYQGYRIPKGSTIVPVCLIPLFDILLVIVNTTSLTIIIPIERLVSVTLFYLIVTSNSLMCI